MSMSAWTGESHGRSVGRMNSVVIGVSNPPITAMEIYIILPRAFPRKINRSLKLCCGSLSVRNWASTTFNLDMLYKGLERHHASPIPTNLPYLPSTTYIPAPPQMSGADSRLLEAALASGYISIIIAIISALFASISERSKKSRDNGD